MNVIISNQQDNIINSLSIEVIKSLQGEFEVDDIINTFSNFFFSRMIIDVTALKNYTDIVTYQKLSIGLPVDKIILVVPSQTEVASDMFLSKLISLGYYNFTTNMDGVIYLLDHPNSYRDVAHIHQLDTAPTPVIMTPGGMGVGRLILGLKNVTSSAGATTLAYLMYKELVQHQGMDAIAVEVNKRDFSYFNDPNLVSTTTAELANTLLKNQSHSIILVDLNDAAPDVCGDVIYLVEPSIIKMNKLIKRDRSVFNGLRGKKIVLNKTMINSGDVKTFEREAGIKVFHTMPAIDDRTRSEAVMELLGKLGIISYYNNK